MDSLLEQLDARIRRIVEEVVAARDEKSEPPPDVLDEETRAAIREQALLAHKTYLTRKEASKYLNVSERAIADWALRPPDQNPFPERYAGADPRTRRADADEWMDREKQRQRLKLAG